MALGLLPVCALLVRPRRVTAFRTAPTITQSVLTGNIRANAVTKLSVFGLDGYIDSDAGGYGSDDRVLLSAIPGRIPGRRCRIGAAAFVAEVKRHPHH